MTIEKRTAANGSATIYLGDMREVLRTLPENSIDAIVCDPPYELTDGRKASPARVFAEVMFEDSPPRPSESTTDIELDLLAREIATLCGVGVVPCPSTAMPVGAVALKYDSPLWYHDIEDAQVSAKFVADNTRSVDAESKGTKHLGNLSLKSGDVESAIHTLARSACSFSPGGFWVGLRVGFSRSNTFCGGGNVEIASSVFSESDHTLRHSVLFGSSDPASVETRSTTVYFLLPTTGSTDDTADGAWHFDTLGSAVFCSFLVALSSCAVGTFTRAKGVAPVRKSNAVRLIFNTAHGACSIDLETHGSNLASGGFMGKAWDASRVAFDPATWAECLRVLKPGGYLVAFGATRTSHRITCAIEDAGFEIRDTLQWVFGSGFPKSLDVGKAIDKDAGAVREVIGKGASQPVNGWAPNGEDKSERFSPNITAPATDLARTWHGYGTALKPAHEPITLARKPLSGTVARNVAEWGTGGIDVDGCRVGDGKRVPGSLPKPSPGNGIYGHTNERDPNAPGNDPNVGRWPPNIILGDGAAEVIDGMSGVTVSKAAVRRNTGASQSVAKGKEYPRESMGPPRNGGASEFFPTFCYTPKANRKEREAGLAEAGIEPITRADVTEREEGSAGLGPHAGTRRQGEIRNTHPTVKPVSIMQWLVRLVSPPRALGPVVLDPFCGSGTTGIACMMEGVRFIGCELDPRHTDIATSRLDEWYVNSSKNAKPDPRARALSRRKI